MTAPRATTELALEKRARALVGASLAAVRYQTANWDEPRWAPPGRPEVHSVDLAVYLETGRAIHRVCWADELKLRHGYGVSVKPVKVPDRDQGPIHELSAAPGWADLIGQRITSAGVHWKDIQPALRRSLSIGVAIGADHLTRRDYPQTLELCFASGARVFLSAARLAGDAAVPFTNNLLVLFTADALRAFGL